VQKIKEPIAAISAILKVFKFCFPCFKLSSMDENDVGDLKVSFPKIHRPARQDHVGLTPDRAHGPCDPALRGASADWILGEPTFARLMMRGGSCRESRKDEVRPDLFFSQHPSSSNASRRCCEQIQHRDTRYRASFVRLSASNGSNNTNRQLATSTGCQGRNDGNSGSDNLSEVAKVEIEASFSPRSPAMVAPRF